MKSLVGTLVLGLFLSACGKEPAALPNGRAKARPSNLGGTTYSRTLQKGAEKPCPPKSAEGRSKESKMRDRILQVRCYGQ